MGWGLRSQRDRPETRRGASGGLKESGGIRVAESGREDEHGVNYSPRRRESEAPEVGLCQDE